MKSNLPALLLATLLLLPTAARAESTERPQTGTDEATRGQNFCTVIQAKGDALAKRATSGKDAVKNARTQETTKLQDGRQSVSKKQQAERSTEDQKQAAAFAKLEGTIAVTPDRKQAVLAFEDAVKAAVATRRSAVQAAQAKLQQAVDADRAARQTQIDKAVADRAAAVAADIAQAKSSCASGTDSSAVRAQLLASQQAEEDSFKATQENANKGTIATSQYVATYTKSVQAANDAFRKAVTDAKTTLKSSPAFKADK
jgi:hypothetical protein